MLLTKSILNSIQTRLAFRLVLVINLESKKISKNKRTLAGKTDFFKERPTPLNLV
jgi:hypothetical protein